MTQFNKTQWAQQGAQLFSYFLVAGLIIFASIHVFVGFMIKPSIAEAEAANGHPAAATQSVMFVGNNWDGTVTIIESSGEFTKLGAINAIPDKKERMREIRRNFIRLFYFLGIRETVGEGNDQYVDDMYSTADGSALVISRPSFADVISLDLRTGNINWRFPIEGYRSDHMAISPDGTEVAVSASTGNVVHMIDVATGEENARYATGDKPHENHYIDGGRFIVTAAIGNVNSPFDAPWLDFTKGDRKITIYDREQGEVATEIDMRERLDAFGRSDLSDSIRPYSFSPDEDKLFFQVSFFNGIIEYDFDSDRILRIIDLPEGAAPKNRRKFVNDSRHHGLSISRDGEKLCVAGTMDEYATIVDVASGDHGPLIPAGKPYWATVSADGSACVISESDTDVVSVIDFATGEKRLSVDVGNHPQRVRLGSLPQNWESPTPTQ